MEATLIVAMSPHMSLEDACFCLILCKHEDGVDVEEAVKEAFAEWAKTDEGKEFIDSNGTNWGDSLDIPDDILRKHGINRYEGLLGGDRVVGAKYDHEIRVDHGENLVEGQ
jgi:hypothetical protein